MEEELSAGPEKALILTAVKFFQEITAHFIYDVPLWPHTY